MFEWLSKLLVRKATPPPTRLPRSVSSRCYLTRDIYCIKSEADLVKLQKRVPGSSLKGRGLNLNGAILDGSKLKGSGSQDENQDPLLRIELEDVEIRGGFCQNLKDGLNVSAPDVLLRQLTFLDVGEDAINNKEGAIGLLIEHCEFISTRSTTDKILQINEGQKARIIGCTFIGPAITGIRLGDKWSHSSDVATVEKCQFYNVDTGFNLARIQVRGISTCSFNGVRLKLKHSLGSKG